MLLWHYTTFHKFKAIDVDGLIKPSTVGLLPGERPVVWFSANQTWDATANKSVIERNGRRHSLTREGTHLVSGGLIRIGVEPKDPPRKLGRFQTVQRHPPEDSKGASNGRQ